MADLLKKMVTQAKQEGRETLRQLVAAYNGKAGVLIIQEEYEEAVETYRKAMAAWKTHENNYDCDKLQRIHTLENLSILLKDGHSSLTRAISDDDLDTTAEGLRSEYIKKQKDQVLMAIQALCIGAYKTRTALAKSRNSQMSYLGEEVDTEEEEDVVNNMGSPPTPLDDDDESENKTDEEDFSHVMNLQHFTVPCTFKIPSVPWWSSVISWAVETSKDKDLYMTLETELQSSPDYLSSLSFIGFTSLSGFQYSVMNHIEKLESERLAVLESVDMLSKSPSQSLILAATQCHLKANRTNPSELCEFCLSESSLKSYEGLLFSRYQIRAEENDTSRSMSIVEKLLKTILSFINNKGGPPMLCESGAKLLSYFEALRKEFKYITRVWMAAEQQVRACDELSMAAERFQLIPDSLDQETAEFEPVIPGFFLFRRELFPKLLQFSTEIEMSTNLLKKNIRQLSYLQNLARVQGEETSTCPICVGVLNQTQAWAVLPCGHSFCLECLYSLFRHRAPPTFGYNSASMFDQLETIISRRISFTCPLCRESVISDKISYIRPSPVDKELLPLFKGNYSTKVTAVTGKLLKIRQENNQTKSLVFSSNSEVLKLISHALQENDIEHTLLIEKKGFEEKLKEFKTSSVLNVLLMPMSSGSKGLNIVEATQVLLVEPSLNIGMELQAIGRVHRLGQTQPTTVHRFYVMNTIEERIKELTNNTEDILRFFTSSDTECNLTVAELEKLFIRNNSA